MNLSQYLNLSRVTKKNPHNSFSNYLYLSLMMEERVIGNPLNPSILLQIKSVNSQRIFFAFGAGAFSSAPLFSNEYLSQAT